MNDRPTPKTDSSVYLWEGRAVAPPSVARRLERERDEARESNTRNEKALWEASKYIVDLKTELADAREQLESTDIRPDHAKCIAELIAARQQRDKLAEALESIEEYWNKDQNETAMADACWHAVNTAREALAAVKGDKP